MDRERVEKLKKLVASDEETELTMLYDAYVNSLEAYKIDNTKPPEKLKAYQAAKKALMELVENFENKYLTGVMQFRNIMEALRYLQNAGWKIGKSKLYEDRDAGKFKINTNKSVDETEILAYAAKWLEKIKATGDDDHAGIMAEEKLTEEISLKKLQADKLRFEIAREKGQYIHRSKWLAELASKLSASKFVTLQVARTKAPELIAAVGGDLKKEGVFSELFTEYIEDAFNELAMAPELKFLVKS